MTEANKLGMPLVFGSTEGLGGFLGKRTGFGMLLKRFHNSGDLCKMSSRAFFGYCLFGKGEVTHHCGVNHVVLKRKNSPGVLCDEAPVFSSRFHDQLAQMLLVFRLAGEEARHDARQCANKCGSDCYQASC